MLEAADVSADVNVISDGDVVVLLVVVTAEVCWLAAGTIRPSEPVVNVVVAEVVLALLLLAIPVETAATEKRAPELELELELELSSPTAAEEL